MIDDSRTQRPGCNVVRVIRTIDKINIDARIIESQMPCLT